MQREQFKTSVSQLEVPNVTAKDLATYNNLATKKADGGLGYIKGVLSVV